MNTFNDEETYLLFIAVDNWARFAERLPPGLLELRERLLPVYSNWHRANPHKVHPSALTSGNGGK